ncbi:Translationally-controlled tumor protein [Sciurus carolinensis]|uniref:Translationally-controlled tumor protein n=1 Tax=Sciurus carolinensis TaxID=30640 RepID=A0AA41NE57_SCICA|nr:Translationally-controlled tumor protein [Sciurus carolinensis]
MIIYRDLISRDEMFSDIYKIQEIVDGLCLEVEGKMVSRTEGNIDDSLIGGNASAEGPKGKSVKEVNQDPPMLDNDKGMRKSDQVYLYNADF